MNEIKSRPYQPGDEEQIVPLLIESYNGWPFFDLKCSPVEHWLWRYLDNPQHNSLLSEILDGNRIVGSGHNVLHDMLINGRKTLASYGTDACVHPEYQGKGLYRILVEKLVEGQIEAGVEFNYMVTVHDRVINSKSQMKATPYVFPHSVRYLERIDDLDLHLQVKEFSGEYGWRLRHLIEQLKSKPMRAPQVEIQTIDCFDEEFLDFLNEVNGSYDYIKHRTLEYLNWRYLDPRGGNYEVQALYEHGEFNGYGVFRVNRLEKYPVGYIVDLLTLPSRIDAAESLLLSGLEYFKENNVNQVIFQVVEGHPYEELFKHYGFYGGEGNRHIFYNYKDNQALNVEKISPEKIHFPFGDLTGI